ncbi:aminotransferase class I/II-fold pyridoxal phosphate-dependent enzyme [Kitasatospora sp. NPDC088264]|uniref:aminotransferase class I/II-fold pyridoxal phosphate-dependent enzyme n=1 Tax=unclassified Kitasatospora TaxID=2633591 RepID=UPI003413C794
MTVATPARHARRWQRGLVQETAEPGVIDLGPGYLDPALLPVELVREAQVSALAEFGAAALAYGNNAGAHPLREALAERATRADGHPCGPENVLVTAGTSQALYLISTALASPGDAVLTDGLCYDLAQKLFTDCRLTLRRVPADSAGMSPQALRETLRAPAPGGVRPAFLYLNPTFHNPTGRTLTTARRRELLAVAAEYGLLVVEDDAYAGLALDPAAEPPQSLAALADHRGVLRLGTFSKTLAPGLRLGWLLGDPALVDRLAAHGLFVSGGSLNHTASLAAAVVLANGEYDRHVAFLCGELAARRDALVAGLRAVDLPEPVRFRVPSGGYFLWLEPVAGHREAELLRAAALAGVRIAAGSRFGPGGENSFRLAFSFNSSGRLVMAAERLAAAWRTLSPPSTTHPSATPLSTGAECVRDR